jgi:hypothetical protein
MKLHRLFAIAALSLAAAGCATVETATRNAPLNVPGAETGQVSASRSYTVQDVRVVVPQSLRVSEANGYYPITDIVWRGDPIGDRHAQVAALFETAAARGAETLKGDRDVVVDLVVSRFHGLTERTRFSVGGVYNMEYTLTVRDAATGAIIEGPRFVESDLGGPGGQAAVMLEQEGQTEKVRVVDFLTLVLMQQLGGAEIPQNGV